MPQPEPWLRNTLTDIDPIRRAVLHAIELTAEDATRWCAPLTEAQLHARPAGVPSIAFHLRHIARSLDRLLTYAEGHDLNATQLEALTTESASLSAHDVLHEFHTGLNQAVTRIRALPPEHFAQPRTVGRQHLPTTVVGLLSHCADHTQRHTGQFITTAKVVTAATL